jgi:hypothetical protein
MKKRIDNPSSAEHYRYHHIVNRWAFIVISSLISGLCAMTADSWLGALLWPAFIALSLASVIVVLGVYLALSELGGNMKEFYKGY